MDLEVEVYHQDQTNRKVCYTLTKSVNSMALILLTDSDKKGYITLASPKEIADFLNPIHWKDKYALNEILEDFNLCNIRKIEFCIY